MKKKKSKLPLIILIVVLIFIFTRLGGKDSGSDSCEAECFHNFLD